MTQAQERRLRELRLRAFVRGWDVYSIPSEEARRLVAEGCAADPVGDELLPPRIVVIVPAARVAAITSARSPEVRRAPSSSRRSAWPSSPSRRRRPAPAEARAPGG